MRDVVILADEHVGYRYVLTRSVDEANLTAASPDFICTVPMTEVADAIAELTIHDLEYLHHLESPR